MKLAPIWTVLLPGLAAAPAGWLVHWLTDDALAAALAAGVGAVAGALLQEREETAPPFRRAEATDGRDAEPAVPAPPPEIVRDANGDLPAGFGRLLLERLPLGVVLVSRTGAVLFMNPNARALFGPRAESGFPVEALRAPRLLEAVDRVLETREPEAVEFTLSRTKTVYLCAHVVSVVSDAPGSMLGDTPAVLVAIEDRTQARRTEDLHRDFVANASHELKTPLAAVSGIIETLQGHAREDAAAQERFLTIMAAQTERMKRLVQDLLSLNRIELNERVHPDEPQPLRRLVWEVTETLRPMAEADGVTIRALEPADAPLVPGDREELIQVFVNLVENAVKYGRDPGGGPAEVRILAREGTRERRGMVGIAVEDDGPGIAREHLPRLTERFYRVSASSSRARGGTGLGLAIVKHILYRHRGRLDIESRVGEGSRFTVWLPVHGRAGTAARLADPEDAISG